MNAPFGSGQASEGDDCSACDGTGHVCADDGTASFPAGSHGSRLHPWDGLSERADACDHGGGAPCPACMIPPGQARESAPDVVEGREAYRGLPGPTSATEAMAELVERYRRINPDAVARAEEMVAGMSPEGLRSLTLELFGDQAPARPSKPVARPDLAPLTPPAVPLETGLDRVRAAVERDRPGQLNELGRIVAFGPAHRGCTAYVTRHGEHGGITRPWWRRTAHRLAAAFAARLPTWR